MKCHYEVLEVTRDADDTQIKTAYRKFALKWHPDKNLDNPDFAKEQFQQVQQAYEVLSDRQERAWYDNHREQILRGSNSEFEDNSLDLFQYFTVTCFKGYNDEDNGFYSVYRHVFEKIAQEDIEYMEDKEEFCEIPPFGTSTSDYDNVVGPFYAYWMSYTTKKSYVWLDPYNIKETRDRRIFKLMEKENKKIRQKAKKERNEEIRALVAFVRKRDKRVQEHSKKLKTKIIENRKKQEELSIQKRLERKKQLVESKSQAEWTKFDNVKTELEQIEKNLAEEFGEQLSHSENEDDSEEEETDNLYCVACNKIFKTPKAFQNHELSKKHRENVEKMKESMLEDDDCEDVSEDCNDLSEDCDNLDAEVDGVNKENSNEELSNIDSEDEEIGLKQKKKKRKSKNVIQINLSDHEDMTLHTENDKDASTAGLDDFNSSTSKKQKRKNKKGTTKVDKALDKNLNNSHTTIINEDLQEGENGEADEGKIKTEKVQKPKKSKEKRDKKEQEPTSKVDTDTSHSCVTCKADFPSKNKLFDHLKTTGHSVYLPQNIKVVKNKKKSVREK